MGGQQIDLGLAGWRGPRGAGGKFEVASRVWAETPRFRRTNYFINELINYPSLPFIIIFLAQTSRWRSKSNPAVAEIS